MTFTRFWRGTRNGKRLSYSVMSDCVCIGDRKILGNVSVDRLTDGGQRVIFA